MLKEVLALFDWLRVAILLHFKKQNILFKEGEVWWCSIGMNIGTEIYGKGLKFTRPVLILKKFNANGFLGIPLTSHRKTSDWYAPVVCEGVAGSAVLNQARALDSKRLLTRMGTLDDNDFQSIKKAFFSLHRP